MSPIGGYLGKTPSNWGTAARSGVWSSEDVYFLKSTSAWVSPSVTVVINGTNYSLSAGAPITLTTYGRYTITAPSGTSVKLQLWGAGGGIGGNYDGGAGGYAAGNFTFDSASYLAIVGQAGPASAQIGPVSAYPDGGITGGQSGDAYPNAGAGGGGSSRFGPFVAEASQNSAATAYYLIAGGGGGGNQYLTGSGAGGGTSGQSGTGSSYSAGVGGGGTQSTGGSGGAASTYGGTGGAGSKYKGGDGGYQANYGRGSSGGGGYYGGGAGGTVYASAGGGSGYVDTSKISSSILTVGDYTTPVTPAENNRPSGYGGPAQNGALIITLL